MRADKDKDVKILTHKVQKFKDKAKVFKKCGLSDKKLARMERKQARYETWLTETNDAEDY